MKEHQSGNAELDPEIKEQATKLFDLIEQHIEENGADTTAESIDKEMGDFLKNSDGFRELNFGYELSKTTYERACLSLEQATYHLEDEALSDLFEIIHEAEHVINNVSGDSEIDLHSLNFHLSLLEENLPKLKTPIIWEWKSRTESYRSEIDELKKAG